MFVEEQDRFIPRVMVLKFVSVAVSQSVSQSVVVNNLFLFQKSLSCHFWSWFGITDSSHRFNSYKALLLEHQP